MQSDQTLCFPDLPYLSQPLLVRTDMSLLNLSGHHINIFGVRFPLLNNKTIFVSSKKAAWYTLKYTEHLNQPMNQWSQNINMTEFPGVVDAQFFILQFYYCISVIIAQLLSSL